MEQLRQASVITSALRPAWSYPHSSTQHANTYCHKIAVSCLQLFPAVPSTAISHSPALPQKKCAYQGAHGNSTSLLRQSPGESQVLHGPSPA